jgi:peroxiredoxin
MRKNNINYLKTLIEVLILIIVFFIGYISNPIISGMIARAGYDRTVKYEEKIYRERYMNKPAPIFRARTINDKTWTMEANKGKVSALFFWSTDCGFCEKKLPALNDIFEKYKNNIHFEMIGINWEKNPDMIKVFCRSKNVIWDQISDISNDISRLYNVTRVPSLWIIDKSGITREIFLEPENADEKISQYL